MIHLPNIFSSYSPVPMSTCVQKQAGNIGLPQRRTSSVIDSLMVIATKGSSFDSKLLGSPLKALNFST